MPRGVRKRRPFKRVTTRKRPRFARRFARRPNARLGGFLGIELKFYDNKLINAALTAPTDSAGGEHDPSATILLNTVTQGDGESQRDGRKMQMRSIQITGQIQSAALASQSTGAEAPEIFIALVLDTQTNGATIVSENVFTNPGANGLTAAMPLRNLQFIKRFRILATRRFKLIPATMTNDTGSTGGVIKSGASQRFSIFKRLNMSTTFTGTTETVANIVDNSLHIIAYCTTTSMVPRISYNSRLRFVG